MYININIKFHTSPSTHQKFKIKLIHSSLVYLAVNIISHDGLAINREKSSYLVTYNLAHFRAFVSAHSYQRICIRACAPRKLLVQFRSDPPISVNYILGKGQNKTEGSNNLEGSILENFLMNRGERKGGRETRKRKKGTKQRERERSCWMQVNWYDPWRCEKFFKEDDLQTTSETNFHLDPFDGLFRLLPWQFRMDGERAKKKRKKKKKKVRDVQCLNHSDRRVIAPAKEEINRDLIARIFGFTAIPRVTRFKRSSIVRLSRCLTGTDTVRLAPALRSFGIKFNVSRNDSSGTRRAAWFSWWVQTPSVKLISLHFVPGWNLDGKINDGGRWTGEGEKREGEVWSHVYSNTWLLRLMGSDRRW